MTNNTETNNSHYFLSSGDKTAMFTLRFAIDHDVDSQYICNLSTDSEKAIKKAQEIISNEPYPLNISYADTNLAEILKRNKEQIEADNKKRKEENIAAWVIGSKELIEAGKNPFGKIYSNFGDGSVKDYQLIKNMNQQSINYWASLTEYKSEIHKAMHEVCKPKLIDVPLNANKHFSNIAEKVNVKAMVLEQDYYEDYFGYTLKVKYITENGEKLITKSSSTTKFTSDIFEKIDNETHMWVEIEAKIKSHNSFYVEESKKTWNTTSLIRPKLIKVFDKQKEVA